MTHHLTEPRPLGRSSTRDRVRAQHRPATVKLAGQAIAPRATSAAPSHDAFVWRDLAACRTADPDLFFPDPSDTIASAAALAICHRCPVVEACLDDALRTGELFGIRGGLTAVQRRPLLVAHHRGQRRSLGAETVPDAGGAATRPLDPNAPYRARRGARHQASARRRPTHPPSHATGVGRTSMSPAVES